MNDFKGMDPELARKAKDLIVSKKEALDKASREGTIAINEGINAAFAGAQTSSMTTFVESINTAITNLYKHLEGNDSNFAKKFEEVIASYEASDANVAQSYNSSAE